MAVLMDTLPIQMDGVYIIILAYFFIKNFPFVNTPITDPVTGLGTPNVVNILSYIQADMANLP